MVNIHPLTSKAKLLQPHQISLSLDGQILTFIEYFGGEISFLQFDAKNCRSKRGHCHRRKRFARAWFSGLLALVLWVTTSPTLIEFFDDSPRDIIFTALALFPFCVLALFSVHQLISYFIPRRSFTIHLPYVSDQHRKSVEFWQERGRNPERDQLIQSLSKNVGQLPFKAERPTRIHFFHDFSHYIPQRTGVVAFVSTFVAMYWAALWGPDVANSLSLPMQNALLVFMLLVIPTWMALVGARSARRSAPCICASIKTNPQIVP